MEKTKKIYTRIYDNPKKEDGSNKPSSFLGTFKVEKQISKGLYSEEFIGKREEDNKRYLVRGVEVNGLYHKNMGGIKYTITDIT